MPTLEELLRASLKGANVKFDQANSDLHATVVEAAKAVEAVTGGKATLRLFPIAKDDTATGYDLCVVTVGQQFRKLTSFTVTGAGYPIARHASPEQTAEQHIKSSEELSSYFRKLASDPDSSLVAYLAYIVRNFLEEE
ncbi:hypothetical protein VT84_05875 [Gemmata sp. SH-PL17]|uniref:hypothetical protein n=1 Tax=Gemmata sp. SH-PL17 TaxID=1630693 RepID=UPI00069893B1|nr:hypothetical protein [Gemmata sp. SH-PL17]AMV23903.1 hypothetical protein VT84_05875 [Gemmata sp. SH-PL17]